LSRGIFLSRVIWQVNKWGLRKINQAFKTHGRYHKVGSVIGQKSQEPLIQPFKIYRFQRIRLQAAGGGNTFAAYKKKGPGAHPDLFMRCKAATYLT
jgi:hypothetical protein